MKIRDVSLLLLGTIGLIAIAIVITLSSTLWKTESNSAGIADGKIPKELVEVVENHFQSMQNGDEDAFIATLAVEDPSDVYMEPWTMETLELLKNTEIAICEIAVHNSNETAIEQPFTDTEIMKVTIDNEVDIITFWMVVSKHTGTWGIACYIPETQLDYSSSDLTLSELDTLAKKNSVAEYDLADLQLLLSSSVEDIGTAYGVDMPNEPSEGLILTGRTLAAPVIFIGKGVFLIEGKVSGDISLPFSLLLYGVEGDYTPIEGFTFGEEIDISQHELKDTFFKRWQNSAEEPAKILKIEEEGLYFNLYFRDYGDGKFILDEIEVTLEEHWL